MKKFLKKCLWIAVSAMWYLCPIMALAAFACTLYVFYTASGPKDYMLCFITSFALLKFVDYCRENFKDK